MLAPNETGAIGRSTARATTSAAESRFATLFAPSPLHTATASEPHGPGANSAIAPTSYLGASESTTAERSGVSSAGTGTRYSRVNGILNWPPVNVSFESVQRAYASRRLTAAGVRVPVEASVSTRNRYEKRVGTVPSIEKRARLITA